MDTWKQILNSTGGVRPSSILVLQPQDTTLPQPLCTIMRMTFSKMFVGEDALEFCYLELCLMLNSQPNSKFVIVSDDVEHFGRAFRLQKSESPVFITNQKLKWPLSEASWAKSIQYVVPKSK